MTVTPRLAAGLLLCSAAWAGNSAVWESHSYEDFLKGRFEGVALTRDGRLVLAPALEILADTGDAGIWSLAAAPDGTVYFAGGHRGRLWRYRKGAKPEVVWQAPQPEIFALASDSRGRLFVGTSPNGKVFLFENGMATEFFDPKATYIWSLKVAPDGVVYAGTGDQGKVFRIPSAGQGEVYYETGQTNVTALGFDPQGRLLAGSEPNGILYRIESRGKAFALYDASLQEIRAIVPGPQGEIFVAALGSSQAQKQAQGAISPATATAPAGIVTTSITVTAEAAARAQSGLEVKPRADAPKPTAAAAPESQTPAVPADIPGVEKAAIYRITPQGVVETVWSSKEENILDLLFRDGDLSLGTDRHGRIYQLSSQFSSALLLETREGETTRLLQAAGELLAATSNGGKLLRLGPPAKQGRYISPVHDAGSPARWGRIDWRGVGPLIFRTRSGNSARPDTTWSDWSEPIADPARNQVPSPPARYIQWLADLPAAAALDAVSLSYQPPNSKPQVRSIQVTQQWSPLPPKLSAPSPSTSAYSVTVTDTGEAAPSTSSGTPTQVIPRSGKPQILIAWQADDPDSDTLLYRLDYRAAGESRWIELRKDISENTILEDAERFADGRYLFRVTASDSPSNQPAEVRGAELLSPPVLIDLTPPQVTARAEGRTVVVDSTDTASPLRRAEASVDGGPWLPLTAEDGVIDGKIERFRFNTAAAGEISVVFRVMDAAGNAGLARLVLR
jgi:hypothetical protein